MKQSSHLAISFAILVLAATQLIHTGESVGYPADHWTPIGMFLGAGSLVGWFVAVRQTGNHES